MTTEKLNGSRLKNALTHIEQSIEHRRNNPPTYDLGEVYGMELVRDILKLYIREESKPCQK